LSSFMAAIVYYTPGASAPDETPRAPLVILSSDAAASRIEGPT
jgi:hypothetical protein